MSSKALFSALLLLLATEQVVADTPVLEARPGLCIVQNQESSDCLMGVELSWRAAAPGDYCLHDSLSEQPLACWQQLPEGSHHGELISREDVQYWLQRPGDSTRLAEITVRVVSVAKRGPQRRRRRHPWSVL